MAKHRGTTPDIDTAAINVERICGLTALLADELVADMFSRLDVSEQVAIFASIEAFALTARTALTAGNGDEQAAVSHA